MRKKITFQQVFLTLFILLFCNNFFTLGQNGSCSSPSTIIESNSTDVPLATFTQCLVNPILTGNQIVIFTEVTSSPDGTLGLVQQIQISSACSNSNINSVLASRVAELFPAGDCSGVAISPYTTNAGNSATFNPEWSGLTPNTVYVVKITMTIPNACSGDIQEACLEEYFPALPATADACGTCANPNCPIFNAPDFATSTGTYPLSNAYDPATDLVGPLTFTNCYSITLSSAATLGLKQGIFQINTGCATRTFELKSDCNAAALAPDRTNANGTASGFNPEWDNLPAGTYSLCITTTLGDIDCDFDFSQTGYYIIPNVVPDCPTENTFMTLDWLASNPFTPFTNTSFDCNDGPQTIWKSLDETNWDMSGEIQPLPGFIMDFITNANSPNRTSVLVNVNGVDFSYYGPSGTAPAGTIDWGPCTDDLSTMIIMEPYINAGSTITLTICDTRTNPQSLPYEIYDYANGQLLASGIATPSNGNCTVISFVLSAPVLNWDIDGNASLITSNTDGSATFDPSVLSPGNHVIHYSFSNGTCNLTAQQNITIANTITPTFTQITALCQNSLAPNLPNPSNNGIFGVWNTTISTASPGLTDYFFTPNAGQCAANATMSITVNPEITPIFDAISALCQNSLAPNLPNPSNNGIFGVWNTTISTVSAGLTDYFFTPSSGQCAANATMSITVNPEITPTFAAIGNLCQNATQVDLPSSSTNNIFGTWDNQLSTSTVGVTTYTFTPNANQCASDATINITVVGNPIANASASSLSGNPTLSVDFTNLSSNASSYTWSFGNGDGITTTDLSAVSTDYLNVGVYTVSLTASNGVCPDAVWNTTINVFTNNPLTFEVPNVFTPNGDTQNDEYFIHVTNGKSFEATIFNRWGNEMIHLTELNQVWDGKSDNGDDASAGVYFIVYKIEGLDGTLKDGQQYFHLVR
ncbi:MAG: gliding motility-associated C-terminal domain-containing protein [Flavobacteriia bacterium]|jgi:gliding motility-associated-like protein